MNKQRQGRCCTNPRAGTRPAPTGFYSNFTFPSLDIHLMLGLATINGAIIMILSQTLMATVTFSVGLLCFSAGAALAVWGTASNIGNVNGAKLAGHFVALLSVAVLVFTSYNITIGILSHESAIYRADSQRMNMPYSHHKMQKHKDVNVEPMIDN